MTLQTVLRCLGGMAAVFCLCECLANPLAAQEKSGSLRPWRLEEARRQQRLYPRDTYLQFVALQLARREGRLKEVADEIAAPRDSGLFPRDDRLGRVDLFSIFTGALAIQESLQLDTMRGLRPGEAARLGLSEQGEALRRRLAATPDGEAQTPPGPVDVATLNGPTIKSHPWEKMLAGRKPAISKLARSVPHDFYFVEFKSLTKLLDVMDANELWRAHLGGQGNDEANTQLTGERLKKQLAVEANPLLRPFYDLVVEEVAITGSDLFVNEGSDVTLLFRYRRPELFKQRMDGFLASAEKSRPDVRRTAGKLMDVDYVHLASPDRAVHVYSAYPAPGLHVRSNSRIALERVLEAIKGTTAAGKPVIRLGDTEEFAFVRTLMPPGAPEEDGLIYLSDPFIRNLVGPVLKLTERRRMLCYNHLRILGHAALLYQTEHGRPPESLEALAKANCTPGEFNKGMLVCPDGGVYRLSSDGHSATCSHHGHVHAMTPCCEIPVKQVSGEETAAYKAFLDQYNQYWRTFFDPIAVRIKLTAQSYRLETIILPLIDNSIYSGLAAVLGGKPEELDRLPVPKRNIFTLALRIHKEQLKPPSRGGTKPGLEQNEIRLQTAPVARNRDPALAWADVESMVEMIQPGLSRRLDLEAFVFKGIGNQVSLNIYDAVTMFELNYSRLLAEMLGQSSGVSGPLVNPRLLPYGFFIASLVAPVYVAVPVNDARVVDEFLRRLDTELGKMLEKVPDWARFGLEREFYRFPLGTGEQIRTYALRFGPAKIRFHWGRIGGGLYLTNKPFVMEDLLAMEQALAEPGRDLGPAAHAMLRLRPKNWNLLLPDYRLGWAESNRSACLNNLGPLSGLARAVEQAPAPTQMKAIFQLAENVLGVHYYCPEGGHYTVGSDGKSMQCSIHGSAHSPRQPARPSGQSQSNRWLQDMHGLTATLTFLEDGLHAVLTIDRN